MRKIALAAAAVLFLGVGAQAADLPRAPVAKAPVMAPVPMWQGWYSGIHGGWGWGDADRSFNATDSIFSGLPGVSLDIDGGIFGGHLGYNWQVAPNYLFGLEASIAWTGIDGGATTTVAATSINSDLEWLATFTPRFGWIGNNTLFYVKGGVAGGRVERSVTGPVSFSSGDSAWGWTVGAGLEWMWAPNWIFGIEYNYYDLGDDNLGGVYSGGGTISQRADIKFSSVLARISYKY
jgi:outer membrane immunogenic protein